MVGDGPKLEKASGMFTFASITDVHPINGCRKQTFSKDKSETQKAKNYSDYGLEIHTDHDPHNSKKIKDKTFVLVCRSQQHRDEWLACFSELVGMAPARRKDFEWSAGLVE